MGLYRKKISEDLDIEHISDKELNYILDEAGRNFVYNYLLLGKDVTYDLFIKNLQIYLKILDRTV